MASKYVLYLVIVSLFNASLQDTINNEVDGSDESPLADVAKEILKEKNLENIGGMVSSFLQSDGGKVILDNVMSKLSSPDNVGNIAQVLGGLINSAGATQDNSGANRKSKENDQVNPMELLSGLGSIVGALQGGNGDGGGGSAALLQGLGSLLASGGNEQGDNNAAALIQGLSSVLGSANKESDDSGSGALLQGLGSLLASAATNKEGQGEPNLGILEGLGSLMGNKEGQGINPEMIGSVLNMLASAQTEEKPKSKSSSKTKKGKKGRAKKDTNEFDLTSAINMASSLLNQGSKSKSGSSFMAYLPMIMNTINSFTGPEAQGRADSHSNHKGSFPAIFEKFHLFFDNFLHSDMAKNILGTLGSEKAFKVFQDENGKFSYQKFQELVENHSFRKHWIHQITKRLVDFLKFVADEKTQNKYIFSGIAFVNAFLKSKDFPQDALINTKQPVKSISNFINYGFKKFMDVDHVDSKEYVKPAVIYIQDLLKLARKSIKIKQESRELTDKLTDTINMDIIEPITRVNRAYRSAKAEPTCDRYIFCLINQQAPSNGGSLPGLSKILSKGTSLAAAWFVSSHTKTPYWDLYSDIVDLKDCEALYNDKCNRFHEEEVKVTTEYIHTEL